MAKDTDEDLRGDIDALLKAMVRAAFVPRDQVWYAVDEVCEEGADPDALRAYASGELERLWAEQRAVEATWSGKTDCDRLDKAFDDLEKRGIVCRQDFTCCGNCGVGIGLVANPPVREQSSEPPPRRCSCPGLRRQSVSPARGHRSTRCCVRRRTRWRPG